MIYKDFKGLKLSALGMGCMRLPKCGDKDGDIDEAATKEMLDYALAHGVNYIDTAWGYHDGESEKVTGRCLADHPRGSFYLATKFPGYELSNMDKVVEIFEKQLEKTGVEYFDFYLFHNVCELNIDAYLEHTEIRDYLVEQVKNGRIRHLGFSAHGEIPVMQRFFDAYGDDCEFCQIQLNWMDWDFQDAKGKAKLIGDWGLPIWVMEPLRGGKLASSDPESGLGEEIGLEVKAIRPGASIPEIAFRWLQGIEGVTVTLSGMSNFEQMKQNISFYEDEKPLDAGECDELMKVAEKLAAQGTVPCTACRYCTSECPQGLDIPRLLSLYNQMRSVSGFDFISNMVIDTLPEDERPDACLACGKCASVCPQSIDIPGTLEDFARRLAD